ncbi:MAG: ATP-binding cassette domain-containing protein, partial [Verrucomicrobiales bacterium]
MTPNTNDLTSQGPGAEPEPEWFYDEEGRIVSADGLYYEDYLATLEGDDLASAPYYEASPQDGQIWEQTVPEGWEEYLPQEESPDPVSEDSQPWTPPDEVLPAPGVSASEDVSYAGVGSYYEEPEPEPFPIKEETALPAAKENRLADHGFAPAAQPTRPPKPSHHAHNEAGSQPIVARASSSTVDRAARQELARSLESQKSVALPEGEVLLSTRGLVKVYDGRAVVNGVDIYVRPGEIVGLLGPNGAGKTTTFYMIVG